MAWTEQGFEDHVAAPRRALRDRMADRLDGLAEQAGTDIARLGRVAVPHRLRALAAHLRAAQSLTW